MRKTGFLNTVRILLLGAPLMLAACHSDYGPFPMPSGYMHHDKEHKAPPGPEPVLKNIEHMKVPHSVDDPHAHPHDHDHHAKHKAMMGDHHEPVQMAATMEMGAGMEVDSSWNMAAHDLVGRLVDGFGQPTEPVYVRPADAASAAEMNLEKALRGALTQRGFNVAPAPGMGPYTLHYAASHLGVGDGTRMMITVSITGSEGALAEESGIYALGEPSVMHQIPAPHEHSGPAMSSGEPVPISPAR